jgi:hypothetical protein
MALKSVGVRPWSRNSQLPVTEKGKNLGRYAVIFQQILGCSRGLSTVFATRFSAVWPKRGWRA